MQKEICRFVNGTHKPRSRPVSQKDILQWFSGTPADWVLNELDICMGKDLVRIVRTSTNRKRTAYRYEITDKARLLYSRYGWTS
jgi:hypothetical protein